MGRVTLWMRVSVDGYFEGLDHRLGLELAETRTFDAGVVQLRYRYSAGDTRL